MSEIRVQKNTTPEDDELILVSVDRFLEKEVAPYVRALETEDTYPQEIGEGMNELQRILVLP